MRHDFSGLGALRSIAGNNVWTGDIVANPIGTVSRIAADADLLTITGNITLTGGAADQLALQGVANITITGIVSGTSGITSSSNGAGVRTLSGANTYTGITRINGGTLVATTLNSVNGGVPLLPASSLGAPTDAATGTITIGSTANVGVSTLRYTGTGETTDRAVALPGTTGTNIIEQAGGGLLKFTSGITSTGASVKTLVLQGSTAGTGEVAGVIANGTGTVGVTKDGIGTWTLSATNTYTGPTNVNAGTLIFAADQTLTALTIAHGATALLGAPAPAPDFAEAFGVENLATSGAAAVPEPGALVSFLGGMLTLLGRRRRRA